MVGLAETDEAKFITPEEKAALSVIMDDIAKQAAEAGIELLHTDFNIIDADMLIRYADEHRAKKDMQ